MSLLTLTVVPALVATIVTLALRYYAGAVVGVGLQISTFS